MPAEPRHQQQRGDQKQVQHDRRRRGSGEAVDRVQQPALQRRQRDEQEIGKGDAREGDDERELAGRGIKPGRDHPHHRRHEDFAEEDKAEQHREQDGKGFLGKVAHRRLAAFGQRPRGQRHEGGAEGAFGEQAAEQVGQPLRDEERVGHRSRPEDRRGQDVADEAEDPAHQRIGTDRGDRAEQRHAAPV